MAEIAKCPGHDWTGPVETFEIGGLKKQGGMKLIGGQVFGVV